MGSAFVLRPNEESLSVFDPKMCNPESLLFIAIKVHLRYEKSQSPNEKIKSKIFFEENGRTVEELLSNGWAVFGVPVSVFIKYGFRLSEPDRSGHIQVFGSRDNFETQGIFIASESFLVLGI